MRNSPALPRRPRLCPAAGRRRLPAGPDARSPRADHAKKYDEATKEVRGLPGHEPLRRPGVVGPVQLPARVQAIRAGDRGGPEGDRVRFQPGRADVRHRLRVCPVGKTRGRPGLADEVARRRLHRPGDAGKRRRPRLAAQGPAVRPPDRPQPAGGPLRRGTMEVGPGLPGPPHGADALESLCEGAAGDVPDGDQAPPGRAPRSSPPTAPGCRACWRWSATATPRWPRSPRKSSRYPGCRCTFTRSATGFSSSAPGVAAAAGRARCSRSARWTPATP